MTARVPPAVVQPEELAATPAAALDLLGDVWQQNTPQRASVQAALAAVEGSENWRAVCLSHAQST